MAELVSLAGAMWPNKQADHFKRQNLGSNGIHPTKGLPDYDEAPTNSANNDQDSHGVSARGSGDQLPLKSRQGSRGTGFARGGSTVNKNPYATPLPDGHALPPSISVKHRATPNVMAAWTTKQRGKVMRIATPHPAEGLVLNVHLSPVGPNAVSLTHSGGVKMAERNLQSDARMPAINPFQWGKSG